MASTNTICGEVLSKHTAQYFLELWHSLHINILWALECDTNHNLASQKLSTWTVRSTPTPDTFDEAIVIMKSKIASQDVSIYEEWKDIKYGSAYNWPRSPYSKSLWTEFSHAMKLKMWEARNWFSHNFGKRKTTLEEEKEQWCRLLQEYRELLPVIEELVGKLEAALGDEGAWMGSGDAFVKDKIQPYYARDCIAVQLLVAVGHQKRRAGERQTKLAELDDQVREQCELKKP
jgi:hypothetical protein